MHALESPSLRWMSAATVAFIMTVGAGLLLVASQAWTAGEEGIVVAVNAAHASILDAIALAVNVVFGPIWAAPVGLALIVVVGVRSRTWAATARAALLLAVPWALADVVKVLVQRPRPDAALLQHPLGIEPLTFSFPSGHTAFAVALAVTAIVLVARRWRPLKIAMGTMIVVVTAWSRVYLGAHYPTDVLASILLVPVIVLAVYVSTARLGRTPPAEGGMVLGRRSDRGEEA